MFEEETREENNEDSTEIDIYDNLNEFDLGTELAKLKDDNVLLEESIEKYQREIELLRKQNEELAIREENVAKNITKLYKTAKNEITRKDRQIAELNRKLDDLHFRRFNRNKFHTQRPVASQNEDIFCQNNVTSLEVEKQNYARDVNKCAQEPIDSGECKKRKRSPSCPNRTEVVNKSSNEKVIEIGEKPCYTKENSLENPRDDRINSEPYVVLTSENGNENSDVSKRENSRSSNQSRDRSEYSYNRSRRKSIHIAETDEEGPYKFSDRANTHKELPSKLRDRRRSTHRPETDEEVPSKLSKRRRNSTHRAETDEEVHSKVSDTRRNCRYRADTDEEIHSKLSDRRGNRIHRAERDEEVLSRLSDRRAKSIHRIEANEELPSKSSDSEFYKKEHRSRSRHRSDTRRVENVELRVEQSTNRSCSPLKDNRSTSNQRNVMNYYNDEDTEGRYTGRSRYDRQPNQSYRNKDEPKQFEDTKKEKASSRSKSRHRLDNHKSKSPSDRNSRESSKSDTKEYEKDSLRPNEDQDNRKKSYRSEQENHKKPDRNEQTGERSTKSRKISESSSGTTHTTKNVVSDKKKSYRVRSRDRETSNNYNGRYNKWRQSTSLYTWVKPARQKPQEEPHLNMEKNEEKVLKVAHAEEGKANRSIISEIVEQKTKALFDPDIEEGEISDESDIYPHDIPNGVEHKKERFNIRQRKIDQTDHKEKMSSISNKYNSKNLLDTDKEASSRKFALDHKIIGLNGHKVNGIKLGKSTEKSKKDFEHRKITSEEHILELSREDGEISDNALEEKCPNIPDGFVKEKFSLSNITEPLRTTESVLDKDLESNNSKISSQSFHGLVKEIPSKVKVSEMLNDDEKASEDLVENGSDISNAKMIPGVDDKATERTLVTHLEDKKSHTSNAGDDEKASEDLVENGSDISNAKMIPGDDEKMNDEERTLVTHLGDKKSHTSNANSQRPVKEKSSNGEGSNILRDKKIKTALVNAVEEKNGSTTDAKDMKMISVESKISQIFGLDESVTENHLNEDRTEQRNSSDKFAVEKTSEVKENCTKGTSEKTPEMSDVTSKQSLKENSSNADRKRLKSTSEILVEEKYSSENLPNRSSDKHVEEKTSNPEVTTTNPPLLFSPPLLDLDHYKIPRKSLKHDGQIEKKEKPRKPDTKVHSNAIPDDTSENSQRVIMTSDEFLEMIQSDTNSKNPINEIADTEPLPKQKRKYVRKVNKEPAQKQGGSEEVEVKKRKYVKKVNKEPTLKPNNTKAKTRCKQPSLKMTDKNYKNAEGKEDSGTKNQNSEHLKSAGMYLWVPEGQEVDVNISTQAKGFSFTNESFKLTVENVTGLCENQFGVTGKNNVQSPENMRQRRNTASKKALKDVDVATKSNKPVNFEQEMMRLEKAHDHPTKIISDPVNGVLASADDNKNMTKDTILKEARERRKPLKNAKNDITAEDIPKDVKENSEITDLKKKVNKSQVDKNQRRSSTELRSKKDTKSPKFVEQNGFKDEKFIKNKTRKNTSPKVEQNKNQMSENVVGNKVFNQNENKVCVPIDKEVCTNITSLKTDSSNKEKYAVSKSGKQSSSNKHGDSVVYNKDSDKKNVTLEDDIDTAKEVSFMIRDKTDHKQTPVRLSEHLDVKDNSSQKIEEATVCKTPKLDLKLIVNPDSEEIKKTIGETSNLESNSVINPESEESKNTATASVFANITNVEIKNDILDIPGSSFGLTDDGEIPTLHLTGDVSFSSSAFLEKFDNYLTTDLNVSCSNVDDITKCTNIEENQDLTFSNCFKENSSVAQSTLSGVVVNNVSEVNVNESKHLHTPEVKNVAQSSTESPNTSLRAAQFFGVALKRKRVKFIRISDE